MGDSKNSIAMSHELRALLSMYRKVILTLAPGACCPKGYGFPEECLRKTKGRKNRFRPHCQKCWQKAIEQAEKDAKIRQ